jgi:hypothetical protein
MALVENVDYYMDKNGLLVFTAKYLLDRGFCCGNGCRHCPYGTGKDEAKAEDKEMEEDEK